MGIDRMTTLLTGAILLGFTAASGLNVSTYKGGTDVVKESIVNQTWNADTKLERGCNDYWSDFYVSGANFTLSRNSTRITGSNGIASGLLYRYGADKSRVGVQLSCHQSGLALMNLSFISFHEGHSSTLSIFWRKECVVYPVWRQLADPGNVGMVMIAIAVVLWGGLRAENKISQAIQQEAGEDAEISVKKAVFFVIGASISLVLIFYFLKMMSVLLTISFCFLSTVATAMLIYSIIQPTRVGSSMDHTSINIPTCGPVSHLVLLSGSISLCFVLLWFFTRHWAFNNILGISICMYMMTVLRLPSIKVSAVLLTLLFCYDIFWVFYSKPIFGKNVMVHAAKGLDLPIKLLLPRNEFLPCYESSFTMLGLGDMALPGLLGVFCRRFDLKFASTRKVGYFMVFISGYTAGIVTCFVVLFVFKAAQPALLYLVPCTLGSVVLVGMSRGQLKALWVGIESGSHRQLSQDQNSNSSEEVSLELSQSQDADSEQVERLETEPMLSAHAASETPDIEEAEQELKHKLDEEDGKMQSESLVLSKLD